MRSGEWPPCSECLLLAMVGVAENTAIPAGDDT